MTSPSNNFDPNLASAVVPEGLPPLRRRRPSVTPPREMLPIPLVLAIGFCLAAGLFVSLYSNRDAQQPIDKQRAQTIAPLPPLALSVARDEAPLQASGGDDSGLSLLDSSVMPRPGPALQAPLQQEPVTREPDTTEPDPPTAAQDSTLSPERSASPALVLDSGADTAGAGQPDAEGQAAAAVNPDQPVTTSRLPSRKMVVPEGTLIHAVLETPLNSDRPGMARAIVSRPVKGFDTSTVLIPRGSRLVGEFKADPSLNLRRILVIWSRVIRPDGVTVRLASPASDSLGGSGVPGRVNTHFFARFGEALLVSALEAGTNVLSQRINGSSGIFVGLPPAGGQLGQSMGASNSRPPTVKVAAGAEIAVFVAHDLDFSGAPLPR